MTVRIRRSKDVSKNERGRQNSNLFTITTMNNVSTFCSDYVEKHNLGTLFEDMMTALIIEKPDNPIDFLKEAIPSIDAPRIILAGPPASGKGTAAEKICKHLSVVHISVGDLLRNSIRSESPTGLEAKKFMDSGKLVPDNIIISIVSEELRTPQVRQKGWLLDGFPRTSSQAKALILSGHIPHVFIDLKVPDEVIVERITGRRLDPDTGDIYHITHKPPPPEIEDRVVQRDDDTEETAVNRLETYHLHSECVSIYFDSVRCEVDGLRSPSVIFDDIASIIKTAQRALPPRRRPRTFVLGATKKGVRSIAKRLSDATGCVLVSPMHFLTSLNLTLTDFLNGKGRGDLLALLASRLKSSDCHDRGFVVEMPVLSVHECKVLNTAGITPNRVVTVDCSGDVAEDVEEGVEQLVLEKEFEEHWSQFDSLIEAELSEMAVWFSNQDNCNVLNCNAFLGISQVCGKAIEFLRRD
ncbi:hypothetical protein GEMRC1_000248 [Eukaryota sp. GEM-RC1]